MEECGWGWGEVKKGLGLGFRGFGVQGQGMILSRVLVEGEYALLGTVFTTGYHEVLYPQDTRRPHLAHSNRVP